MDIIALQHKKTSIHLNMYSSVLNPIINSIVLQLNMDSIALYLNMDCSTSNLNTDSKVLHSNKDRMDCRNLHFIMDIISTASIST